MPNQFLESPRFPDAISYGAVGGPGYRTDVTVVDSGFEQANAAWAASRHAYDVAHGLKTQVQLDELIAFFRVVKGRAVRFRFKDWTDFSATQSQGRMGTPGVGLSGPTYQAHKRYLAAATSFTITAITQANPGQVTTSAPHDFITGQQAWIEDVAGMIQINGAVYTITVLSTTTFTIGISTTSFNAYTSGGTVRDNGLISDRIIQKPRGTISAWRGGSPLTFGTGAGQIALDARTGVFTFVADAQQNVTAVTPGATTDVTLAAALAPLAVGESLWLQDLTGTIASTLNNKAHRITAIASATYTLAVVTTGLSWTSGGTGRAYPQMGEKLEWAGEFDVPVRFDTDQMKVTIATFGSFSWGQIPILEVRL